MLSVALSLSPAEAEPAGRYPAPLFRGARTFLVSLARPAAARPSGKQRYSRFVDRFRVRSVDWPNVTFGWKADIRSRGRTSKPVLARSNPRTSARLVADLGTGRIRVNFQLHLRNLLSLPTRRLIRPTDYGRSFVGGQNRHEGRCGNLHDCHALFDCCPAYVNGLAAQGGTHRDPANRYFKRDARSAPRLPFFCVHPGPRGLGERSGDHSDNGPETKRDTESGSHQADTSRRPSIYDGFTSVLPACTGQARRN
jgi:hypothetical protein